MSTSLPELSFVNNATEKNKKRNEREANSNSISNSDLPSYTLPTSGCSTKYPTGIHNVNTEVLIQKRKRGRPSNKTSKQSQNRVNKTLNDETVFSFINALLNGSSVKELSVKYGISVSTGFKLQRDFFEQGAYPYRKPRGGAKTRKITSEDSEFFCELLRNNPQITSKDIKEKLKERNGKNVSTSSINKHLKGKMKLFGLPNFTVKKCVHVENRRNSKEILDKRIKYINIYKQCLREGRDFVFIDETPFNNICFKNTGRSPVGTPCRVFNKFTKFKNITAITAIHRTFGIICSEFVEGPVTQYVFKTFLNKLFDIMNRYQIRPVYVMDNVRFHKTKLIQDFFTETNNNCLLTAPWSCELNPIEYIFGIWKSRIKIPKDVQLSEIKQLIVDGLFTITKAEVSKSIFFLLKQLCLSLLLTGETWYFNLLSIIFIMNI